MEHQERARCRELFFQLNEFRQFHVFEHDSYLMRLEYSPDDSDLEEMQAMVDWYRKRLESIERMKKICEIVMVGCVIIEHLIALEPAAESKEPPSESKDTEI